MNFTSLSARLVIDAKKRIVLVAETPLIGGVITRAKKSFCVPKVELHR